MLKRLIKKLYKHWVNELYVPEYLTFAIGYSNEACGVIWDSMLPDELVLRVKTVKGWQDVTLKRK